MSVATLFAKFLRKAEKDVQQSVDISKLHDEVVAMVQLEADLANVSLSFYFESPEKKKKKHFLQNRLIEISTAKPYAYYAVSLPFTCL